MQEVEEEQFDFEEKDGEEVEGRNLEEETQSIFKGNREVVPEREDGSEDLMGEETKVEEFQDPETLQELMKLKETQDLFQSNLFRMEVSSRIPRILNIFFIFLKD